MSKKYFSTYYDFLDYLNNEVVKVSSSSIKKDANLEEAKKIFTGFNLPDSKDRIIHIAGTSGKGSTAILIEAILRAHGFTTSLILSPHIYDVRERFQINGRLLEPNQVVGLANFIQKEFGKRNTLIGYFLYNLILGLVAAKKNNVDFQVVETGLGGRLDFTNILSQQNKISVITRIGKDHTKVLGNTYAKIATEKAGIIHTGNTVITLPQRPTVNKIIKQVCVEKNASLYLTKNEYKDIKITNKQLKSDYQQENINLAILTCKQAANIYKFKLNKMKVENALNSSRLPGRFEVVDYGAKTLIFDNSHNAQKLNALSKTFQKLYPRTKPTIIFALKSDKDYKGSLDTLIPIASRFIFTKFLVGQDMSDKSHDPHVLANYAARGGVVTEVAKSTQEIQKLVKREKFIIVTGSTYLLGEIRQLFESAQTISA